MNGMTYTLTYRIRNNQSHREAPRTVAVTASPEQIAAFVETGYLVRPRVFTGASLQALRNIADAIEARVLATEKPQESAGFGGLFVRNIINDEPQLETLIMENPELISIARAVLGPQVQLHALVLRVAYPELANQGVEWHFHQRVVPDPEPAFFARPVVVDHLIYLDDLTPDAGPLVVMPGSHKVNESLSSGDFSDKPGQVVVTCPAGSVVTAHSSLWHKALAPTLAGGKRRLLVVGYSSIWIKPSDAPDKLRERVIANPNSSQERHELAGIRGHF